VSGGRVVSLHVLASDRGCEGGLTRPGVFDCHPAPRVVVGEAGGGEPCLHMLASVHGRDPHCKLLLTPGCGMPIGLNVIEGVLGRCSSSSEEH
jgi:hypothetical protein